MFSNRDIIPNESDFNDTSKVTSVFDDKVPFGDRASSFQSLIMMIGLVLMGVIYAVCYLFSAFFCCKGIQEHTTQRMSLMECLSYEDLWREYRETKRQIHLLEEKYLKLRQRLEVRLKDLGQALKKFFIGYGREEVSRMNPKELPEDLLNDFFHEKRVNLIICSIKGLTSYNLMVYYYS